MFAGGGEWGAVGKTLRVPLRDEGIRQGAFQVYRVFRCNDDMRRDSGWRASPARERNKSRNEEPKQPPRSAKTASQAQGKAVRRRLIPLLLEIFEIKVQVLNPLIPFFTIFV